METIVVRDSGAEPVTSPADIDTESGVRRQFWSNVLRLAARKRYTHKVPDFIATLILKVIDIMPIRGYCPEENAFRAEGQLPKLACG
jgi:hypothetical protein